MTKKTLLYDKHVELGAKIVDFAGWMMPVSYTSIITEHNNVRENIGLFDVSHMGEIFIKGKDSVKFLNKLVPQDISKLSDSKAVYCQLTNNNGGIEDDWIVYRLKEEHYLIIVNASRIEHDYAWILDNAEGFDITIENKSNNYSMLAVQGPKAVDLIEKLGLEKEAQPEFFTIKAVDLLDCYLLVSRTGYTGEDGFEIIVKNDSVQKIWDELMTQGKEFGILPIGLGARDTLRLEAALPLYGNDLDENTTPIEAGLAWSVAKNKQVYYNGREVIFEQLKNGINKKLIGLKMLGKSIPRHEYEVFSNGERIGHVTSGGVSPTLNQNIALAYVKNIKDICIGNIVQVKIREKFHDAEIVKMPFVPKKNKN